MDDLRKKLTVGEFLKISNCWRKMENNEILSLLLNFKVFEGVPEEQLKWFIGNSELKYLDEGESIFKSGDPINKILVILEGSFKIFITADKQERELTEKKAGEISGFLPFSRAKVASGTSRVIEKTTLLCLDKSYEREML
ncbi:MAG TPA: cyclic nucleotide-binding domain-containing protein, partial [Algoriphagus sp.]|nr:cyclic nucleotide-binding domain-containing protein [Algoriphagus sp.]